MELHRTSLILGALATGTAVVAGALGSHALFDASSDPKLVNAWDVGVRYQAWHGIALLALTPLGARVGAGVVAALFALGIAAFSGSLYGLATGLLPGAFGWVTPLGGLLLIAGWLVLLWRALQLGRQGSP